MPDNDPSLEKLNKQINEHLAPTHKKGSHAQQHEREIITAHTTALKNQSELRKKSATRGHIVNGKFERYTVDVSDTDALAAADAAEFRRAHPLIGDMVDGKGVLIGTWRLTGSQGKNLSAEFNAYAAPSDLADEQGHRLMLDDAATNKYVANLKNFHGHDGETYLDETAFREAIISGKYKGGWIVPTQDLVKKNLYAYRNEGALKNTFNTEAAQNSTASHYRTCSKFPVYFMSLTSLVVFATGEQALSVPPAAMPCRLIRLELKQ